MLPRKASPKTVDEKPSRPRTGLDTNGISNARSVEQTKRPIEPGRFEGSLGAERRESGDGLASASFIYPQAMTPDRTTKDHATDEEGSDCARFRNFIRRIRRREAELASSRRALRAKGPAARSWIEGWVGAGNNSGAAYAQEATSLEDNRRGEEIEGELTDAPEGKGGRRRIKSPRRRKSRRSIGRDGGKIAIGTHNARVEPGGDRVGCIDVVDIELNAPAEGNVTVNRGSRKGGGKEQTSQEAHKDDPR